MVSWGRRYRETTIDGGCGRANFKIKCGARRLVSWSPDLPGVYSLHSKVGSSTLYAKSGIGTPDAMHIFYSSYLMTLPNSNAHGFPKINRALLRGHVHSSHSEPSAPEQNRNFHL